jgi:hypothetical protein
MLLTDKQRVQYSNKFAIFAKDIPPWPAAFFSVFSLLPTPCRTSKFRAVFGLFFP